MLLFFYLKLTYILKLIEVNAILNNDNFYFETELNISLKLMMYAVLINALDWVLVFGIFFIGFT